MKYRCDSCVNIDSDNCKACMADYEDINKLLYLKTIAGKLQ